MDLEYDKKFEEMKKYIPFLESMIKRLESTSPSSANPRQAQLDKIRSLRDLLMNKKKRMKMENLLKCEQVLVNLYAKVEQRDKKAPDPGFAIDPPTPQEKSDLEAVRNKLKTVAKRQEEVQETLPEILRVNEVEEVHTAGSKEPALFQRRPNKASLSPTRHSPTKTKDDKNSPQLLAAKRNYTRVLVSPEANARHWSTSENTEEKPLFSRRSPRRSPRRYSPSYHKKERKKSSKELSSRKSKDLNITLNVPEDSLSTLNTKDIFTRIINCSDGDVDITTLRELRKQILTELQKTGARDDISDLILKSYNKKGGKLKRKEEVEEGELSDSESEVIENVYGNLCGNLVLKDQNETKTSSDKDKARKIQICLVINSDKDNTDSNIKKNAELSKIADVSELEMYTKDSKEENKTESHKEENQPEVINIDDEDEKNSKDSNITKANKEVNSTNKETNENDVTDVESQLSQKEVKIITPKESIQYQANFYKPLIDNSESIQSKKLEESKEVKRFPIETEIDSKTETNVLEVSPYSKNMCNIESQLEKMENTTEIPLLNEPTIPKTPTNSTVSEIDILQALKNEILSESITIPGSEASTPLLHQPKIIKVASAKEILPKKRISIEKYKQKAVNSTKLSSDEYDSLKDDLIKKPSLKLTDKECERFNFPKISFDDDSSDGDDGGEIQASDVYSDLAPKSPDHDDSSTIESIPPVIIPVDPVKTVQVNHKADIDMRTLPVLSPNKNKNKPTVFSNIAAPSNNETTVDIMKTDTKADQSKSQNRPSLLDPRVRREFNSKASNLSPNPHTGPDRTPRPVFSNINQSPATNPVMTPNSRSFEMTPNHQSFDIDQSNNKHVYVPTFTMFDSRERETSVAKDTREKLESPRERKSRFDDLGDVSWSSSDVSQNLRHSDSFTGEKYNKGQKNDRYSLDNRDLFLNKKLECPNTPVQSFGRSDVTSNQNFGRLDKPMTPLHPFGRADCPTTPSHPFGRSECPPTPSHTFGRSECPPTPSHPFGRLDCPSTPNHPFGGHSYNINECPLTPNHTFGANECPSTPTPFFGRNDCPPTPNHSFGRSDCPSTPNHPFGRSDTTPNMFGRSDFNTQNYTKDPRLNRKTEYESSSHFDERDHAYYKDRSYYRGSSYKSQKPFSGSDTYQNQDREQGRNSKYRYYAQEQSGRQLNKDQPRREQSVGGSLSKNYENDRLFTRERGRYNSDTRGYEEIGIRRGNQRERSIGRNVIPEDKREKNVGRNVRSEDNFTRSSSRAQSVGRNSSIEPENKTLSVKPHAGRSFTIDTSVNATFQSFLESGKGIEVFEYNFDARRQRAASVGRSLVRESSVGRVLSDGLKRKPESDNKRDVFRRASSMGRDVADYATEKRSFQEIKADFKTYRRPVKESSIFDTGKIRNIDTKSKNTTENIDRSRKKIHEKYKEEKRAQNISKPTYSPRNNCRDPRMRKENDIKNRYNDRYCVDHRVRKSGIVYSNDNIVTGTILTSGYGVKNYKIPKIKRVIQEKVVEFPKKDESSNKKDEKDKRKISEKRKEEETVKETATDDKLQEKSKQKYKLVSKETSKVKNKNTPKGKIKEFVKEIDSKSDTDTDTEKNQIQIDDINKSDEQIERRLTRSSRRILTESKPVTDLVTKNKKPKKSTISDSDSDIEKSIVENKVPKDDKTDLGITTLEVTSPVKEKKVCKKPSAVDVDTSFGLEELEMFSDNVVSDPVLDNINALIADLDNDLDTSKNEASNDFTREITLENMMQNISTPQEDNSSQSGEEFSKVLKADDDFSKTSDGKVCEIAVSNLNKENEVNEKVAPDNTSVSRDSNVSRNFDNLLCTMKIPEGVSIQNEVLQQDQYEMVSADNSSPLSKPTNEDIVSTTETEKDIIPVDDESKIGEQSMDGCSTPDSTINTDEVLEKPKSDESAAAVSTNEEVHGETNVTSTDSAEPKQSSSRAETAPALELGSLLSILQDKSKIKELLSMLGDQSGDNDKIKKKLEKLSEIVSDEEIEEKSNQLEENKTEVFVPIGEKSAVENQTVDEKGEITDEKGEIIEEKAEITKEKAEITQEKDTQLNKNDEDEEKRSAEDFIGEESSDKEETSLQVMKTKYKKKMPVKKSKFSRKGKGRYAKKVKTVAEKRVTRATAAVETKEKPKKPPRELQKLHEDIKEMFIKDDILSATGIRMCRLAKLVDEKTLTKEDVVFTEAEPVVVLEKFKNSINKSRDLPTLEKVRKKPGPKPKSKISTDILPEIEKPLKYKPGPKSRTKNKKESDPYAFETESVADTNTEKASDDDSDNSFDSEICSLASSKSFGSTEILADIKKKTKRKRRGWQDGVIKPKNKKKKVESKLETTSEALECHVPTEKQTIIPDMNCFTDRNYCFRKNELYYSCRLCAFSGTDIVHHYKDEHPHEEIPLSRMAPMAAKEAIEQCKEIDFQAVRKICSEKYVCIFCYQEFVHNNSVLETFFWHVVSMHTGEYKHNCSKCINENQCRSSLDIPPPPKDTKGQLIGYICKKCNFTQLSLENLKTHVINHHNDEQTAVYTINLAAMSKKTLKEFLRRCDIPGSPQQANSRQEIISKRPKETSDIAENSASVCESEPAQLKPAKKTNLLATIQSMITFEADDNISELSDLTSEGPGESTIKIERADSEITDEMPRDEPQPNEISEIDRPVEVEDRQPIQPSHLENERSSPTSGLEDLASQVSNDIVDYPHFKIYITESGAKEYICCINGKDNHFKTTLLISMKKHVQLKHSENWDGYCFICKVIVTPQGTHRFKDCFQHYLDKHMDNFPIFQMPQSTPEQVLDKQITPVENIAPSKTYINVRPIYELISGAANVTPKESPNFPIIQSVVSLGAQSVESSRPSPTYPTMRQDKRPSEVTFKYEEVQAKVMSNKHRVVLETMMARDKLVKVYKCAGRFCSFTSDLAEDSLLHASTHQRIGGVDALNCSYCDFDAMGNAIDLVMHVFKVHGHCQYSCGQCFYRAAASQSVGAHMARVHGAAQSVATVLRTTTVTTNTSVEATMMTREQAVPYYVCNHVESGGACKFRTYTPDKFGEHLQQRHGAAPAHPCYMCQTEEKSPSELVQHMKSHGLKLYQCTWCILGADNEAELLAHVSTVHPSKQPQAYLRIITNKEGSNELRVLPLAFLNKLKVPTEDVTPNTTKENPVREAERSIDLEKLIGLTMIVEPLNEPNETAPVDNEPPMNVMTHPSQQSTTTADPGTQLETAIVAPVAKSAATIISPRQTDIENVQDNQTIVGPLDSKPTVDTPQNDSEVLHVKAEPLETPKTLPGDIVVLDSDEEEAKQSVIDLSDEDPFTSSKKQNLNKKVPIDILSTCPKCRQVCKSMNGLKKHLHYCYPNKEEGSKCAHCPYLASNRDNILQHYMDDHCDRNVYQCGVCRVNLMSLSIVKRHLRYGHKEKDLSVSSSLENGIFCYTVNVARKEKREVPKRKLSVTSTTTTTTTPEPVPKRRFLPQEVNQLPINPIFDHLAYCEICEFSTKVRQNMVRHLQLHARQELVVPQAVPLNPVPHLETNEKHFDRMVNLASSSVMNRAPEKSRPAKGSFVGIQMSPELAARYPKQISARQRNTCGAIGCLYTSVDEPMLKRHWEALHSGPASFNFRCVHCPNNQITDTSKPITASRVVAHLKMHDDTLYACSKCSFYHFKRDFLEKHLTEMHPNGQLMIVRENASAAAGPAPVSQSGATAMDMQLWQCGFCKFKCMLRAEIADHCFKIHQSKMQYRCAYCPYRASAVENVQNHLAHSHPNDPEDLIHYYYLEGSLLDDESGTPRWMIQRQKMGSNLPEIKTEDQGPSDPSLTATTPVSINLNLVKKEVDDEALPEVVESIENLCKRFGNFCEPNGIKFKCPLCNVIMEDTREAMQSHLYEELKYRKWGCGLCSYKAFHKTGLTEHMTTEHCRQYTHIELPTDGNIEKWVAGQLDHQAAIIDKYKTNLAQQKITVEKSRPAQSTVQTPTIEAVQKYSLAQLEEAFGGFGDPNNMMYCCPKCGTLNKDEPSMRDHLEMELNKIRWGCTNCSEKYPTYHEAQFHCKGHDGPSMPKEAGRDPSMRAAWVTNVILKQKKLLQSVPVAATSSEPQTSDMNLPENDNSLLVVRYEERVPTPDQITVRRKRPAQDSDEERLIIDEGGSKKRTIKPCTICGVTCKGKGKEQRWKEHMLKHYNLKPYSCCYCDFASTYRQGVINHTEKCHPNEPMRMKMTGIPPSAPHIVAPKKRVLEDDQTPKLICLFCEKSIPETEADSHLHENTRPDFAKKGDVVVKCCICLALRLDVKSLQDHHNIAHPDIPINYALFKLFHDTREIHYCGYCDIGFKFIRDLKTHHNAVHPSLQLKYTTVPYILMDNNEESKKGDDSPGLPLLKRCARKSTTKLPECKSFAKKSTTKLPYSVPSTSEDGYSYYKTKPAPLEEYANVTTLMSFCNRMMPFTYKKLGEIINIEPKVIVKDIKFENSIDKTLESEK